jgi:O-methyltransferase
VTSLRTIARTIAPIDLYLWRRPLIPQLEAERFNLYLETLSEHADEDGAILEIGCFRGATTVAACRHLRRIGKPAARYVVVDTFTGFVAEQFDQDVRLGTPESFRGGFAGNPLVIVQRTLRRYGLDEVTIVQGDIVELEEQLLPDRIKVCLMDVDLAAPIEAGLEKIWPRVVSGGTVLVDDCEEDTDWRGARHGYRRFCASHGLEERYEAGFGVLRKPSL